MSRGVEARVIHEVGHGRTHPPVPLNEIHTPILQRVRQTLPMSPTRHRTYRTSNDEARRGRSGAWSDHGDRYPLVSYSMNWLRYRACRWQKRSAWRARRGADDVDVAAFVFAGRAEDQDLAWRRELRR